MLTAAIDRDIAGQHTGIAARQGSGDGVEAEPEAFDQIILVGSHDLEIRIERAGSDTKPNPAGKSGIEPGQLLSHQRPGTQGQQERAWRCPAPRHGLKQPARHLHRIGHITAETAMMLAGHHPIEPDLRRLGRLGAHHGDDFVGRQVVVRIEPERDRARYEGRENIPHGVFFSATPSTTQRWRKSCSQAGNSIGGSGRTLAPWASNVAWNSSG